MAIVDLGEVRSRREQAANGPDPDCIVYDGEGRAMGIFAVDWEHDGRRWTVQIAAYDWADAEARVASMKAGLHVTGQVVAKGDAPAW